MSRPVIVFDLDRTLVRDDLHVLILESWCARRWYRSVAGRAFSRLHRSIPVAYLRRKFEYLLVHLVDSRFVRQESTRITSDARLANDRLLRRLRRYRRSRFEVVLVTAAPERIVREFAALIGVEVVGSQTFLGCLTFDLLGKKTQIYERLELEGRKVVTIYSDSRLDFWEKARRNVLVDATGLRIIRE